MAGSWRPHHVQARAPRRRSHHFLAAISLAFVVGFFVGESERSRLLASSVRRTFSSLFVDDDDRAARGPSPSELLGRVDRERSKLERTMIEEEYGEYYGLLFEDEYVLGGVFPATDDASRSRLRRRIQIKVLTAQIEELQPSSSPSASEKNSGHSVPPPTTTTFTWATGGDSAAAGHGNLFSQSYTSVLEGTVRASFSAVGVTFVARNRAMGGYASGPELALCMESVFGSDLDVLSWDFGLTEGGTGKGGGGENAHRAALWGERAGVHPTRPVLFMMDESAASGRWREFQRLEGKGMGAVLMDKSALLNVRSRVPDSNQAPNPENLPPALRYYMCNGAAEGNAPCDDPVRNFVCDMEEGAACKKEKFKTADVCGPGGMPRFQTSWHPGWKEHNLRGRLLGHFMLNTLTEALVELDELFTHPLSNGTAADIQHSAQQPTVDDMQNLLNFLYSREGADVALFQTSPPPSVDAWASAGGGGPSVDTLSEVDPAAVFRAGAVCHTALLPSQARFDGLVADEGEGDGNGGKVGTYRGGYDRGWNKALMPFPDDGRLPLAYDANDRQRCDALEIDHKDFFYVREGDGWLGTTIPTAGEIREYGGGRVGGGGAESVDGAGAGTGRLGMIMVCLKICPNKRCPDESIGFGYIRRNLGKLFIEVDGRPVKQIKKLEGCHFVAGDAGVRWGPGDENGQYRVKFKVEDPGTSHWMKISSIVVF